MGIAQYTSDPVFTQLLSEPADSSQPEPKRNLAALRVLVQLVRNYPDSFLPALRSGRARAAVQRFVQIYSRPSLTWADLPFLRERTSVPIVLKGILHPDDARRAVDEGIDGIVVSNHGGRQVDGAIATLDALPPIVDAVDGRIPVLLDSGSAAAPTSSRPWRSAPARCCSGVRTSTASRWPARPACARW
jgi:lactate 2-monooxygenase